MDKKKKNIELKAEEELTNKAGDELNDDDLDSVAGGFMSVAPIQSELPGNEIK